MRSHRKSSAAIAVFLGFVMLNVWAFRHAWAMTHFSSSGESTIRPEEMSVLGRTAVLFTGVNLPRPVNDQTPADLSLPFERHALRTADGVGLEAWHLPHPDPRATVVLFHGYGRSKSRLLNEARAFHDLNCHTLLVDFRGSGGSEGDTTTLGVFEAHDVAAACELACSLDPRTPLVLYGRSMGSVAILRAIAHYGVRPEGAILECPFDRLLGTVEHRFTAMGLPSFPCAELLVFWGGVQHGMNGFAHNPVEYASRVDCPVLLFHGQQDKRVSVREVEAVCGNLAGKKRLEVFPGVGHEACYRSRPDLWLQHVSAFLDDVTGDWSP
jgi:alpha-beta hydrolase superfamily lysophospholipase